MKTNFIINYSNICESLNNVVIGVCKIFVVRHDTVVFRLYHYLVSGIFTICVLLILVVEAVVS
jgi:hypothetical protein